jgi:hypothetical protein
VQGAGFRVQADHSVGEVPRDVLALGLVKGVGWRVKGVGCRV